jgi:sec-independent protein translocase protein TatB
VFGFSLGELLVICVIALVAVGPQKLPTLLRALGQWMRKARSMLVDVRAQSGIDDLLRAEGFHGGLGELRTLMRDQQPLFSAPPPPAPVEPPPAPSTASPYVDPYNPGGEIDPTKEYPPEGPDAYGAVPDDLLDFEDPFQGSPLHAESGPDSPAQDPPESPPATAASDTSDSVPPEQSAPAA